MRVKVLFLVLLIGILGAPRLGRAEKVTTNQKAKVYNRPGEQGKVVVKVGQGQKMTVLAKEGRWIKVRVSGRTGYIPRTKVDMPEDDGEIARNTRRRPFVDGRSSKRGFGGGDTAPDDRIGADATGDGEESGDSSDRGEGDEPADEGPKTTKATKATKTKPEHDPDDEEPAEDEPSGGDAEEEPADDRIRAHVSAKTTLHDEADKNSDTAFKASPSDVLFVVEKKGKWTLVETDEGEIGYVLTSKLEIDEGGDGGGSRKRILDVSGRVGFLLMSQKVASKGGAGAWPDQGTVGSSAMAVALGGALLYPYKARYLVGGELAYGIAKAVPGIAYDPDGGGPMGGPMPSSTTGFTIHDLSLRAVGGYDLHKRNGMMLFARLAYHYESFLVANVDTLTKNTARLPSEVLKGPMIGAALAIPRLTDKIGLRVNLDTMLVGVSLTQTKNLEDGANPSAKRIALGAAFTYRWKPSMDIQAGYDLKYASLSFGAPIATSMRMHTGTGVSRTDLNHTITVGVAKAF